ncbi:60S ribosomal protein L6B (nucleomorph) [Cryptomonas paramecium]|uniref:60S ribosomal protein L6B n=1 Tax=Cryptomonas paramaecium TaxID=2898 RepID=F2HHA9_9CRYP|nr:60S ribosomal protein L6B [Cryptomonas paramecium]AEA38705.1 60S ribosomal protein L6B [Cryptomonas paramecium]|mmetsp:Transcript_53479/g.141818  ORF Transcript_53479/g.141818 Transcript_53479/m.141818 type:complete len:198 (-) Transcript_53479:8981-9574(-)
MVGIVQWKKKNWLNSVVTYLNSKNRGIMKLGKKNCKSLIDKTKFSNFNRIKKEKIQKTENLTGSIVIISFGKLRGKKAIILRTTKCQMFVISGPFSLNGISIRRIKPGHIITTRNRLDVDSVNTRIFDDEYFIFLKKSRKRGNQDLKNRLKMAHALREIHIDRYLLNQISTNLFLKAYLKAKYTQNSYTKMPFSNFK